MAKKALITGATSGIGLEFAPVIKNDWNLGCEVFAICMLILNVYTAVFNF